MSWRDAAERKGRQLHDFLGMSDKDAAIFFNRGMNAFKVALDLLEARGYNTFVTTPYTFEGPKRVVAGRPTMCVRHYGMYWEPGKTVVGRVALGGRKIDKVSFNSDTPLMYDCAQSGYRNMMGGIGLGVNQFVFLSFEWTKPLGFWGGGGALLCRQADLGYIIDNYLPGRHYYNPREYQCNFSEAKIEKDRVLYANALDQKLREIGFPVYNPECTKFAVPTRLYFMNDKVLDECLAKYSEFKPLLSPYAENRLKMLDISQKHIINTCLEIVDED